MAEYILKINARSKKAQQLINFLKTIDYVDIQEKKENKRRNCVNCGAPLTYDDVCEYCGTIH